METIIAFADEGEMDDERMETEGNVNLSQKAFMEHTNGCLHQNVYMFIH